MFNYVMGPMICPACRDALEEKFKEVKSYIQDHKNVGIKEVAEACDVDVNQIQQWLREERLQLSEGSMIQLTCENCGCEIRSGRFCEKCKNSMANSFSESIKPKEAPPTPKKETKDNPRMRFLS